MPGGYTGGKRTPRESWPTAYQTATAPLRPLEVKCPPLMRCFEPRRSDRRYNCPLSPEITCSGGVEVMIRPETPRGRSGGSSAQLRPGHQYRDGVVHAIRGLVLPDICTNTYVKDAGLLSLVRAGSPNSELQETFNAFQMDATNYNALRAACYSRSHQAELSKFDEIHSIDVTAPPWGDAGWGLTFTIDQGRPGGQNIRVVWGKWCNVKDPGFGTRSTTCRGPVLIDTIVRVKPGESDGASGESRRV